MMTTNKQQTSESQLLLNDDLFDDSFIDPNCFSGDEYFVSETTPTKPTSQLEVFLKPAKSRDDQYESGPFPCSLLCNPYKYDLRVNGEIENRNGSISLTLDLVDSETLQTMQVPPSTGDKKSVQSATALTIESVTKVTERERIIRFSFNLCSFHVQRKTFCLVVKNGDYPVYVSSSFHTYARRREHHNYGRPAVVQTPVKAEPRLSPGSSPHSSPEPQLSMVPPIPMFMGMCQPTFQPSALGQRASPEMFATLGTQERTSLAIQLMTSLSPMERQAVNFYLQSCGAQAPMCYPGLPMPTAYMMPSAHPVVSNTILVGGSNTSHHHHPLPSTIRYPRSR